MPASPDPAEDFDFDLTPRTRTVTLDRKPYVLREASEDAANSYQNAQYRGFKIDEETGKASGILDQAADEVLLSRCLFAVVPGPDGGTREEAVSVGFVRGLPHRVSKPMIRWVKENSEMDSRKAKEADAPKGEPGGGPAGSS
jgi:hypothetical protein